METHGYGEHTVSAENVSPKYTMEDICLRLVALLMGSACFPASLARCVSLGAYVSHAVLSMPPEIGSEIRQVEQLVPFHPRFYEKNFL